MNDTIDVPMLREHLIQFCLISNVTLIVLRTLAANQLDAVDDLSGGIVEIVDDDDVIVRFKQRERRERTDVAGAAVRASTWLTIARVLDGGRCV